MHYTPSEHSVGFLAFEETYFENTHTNTQNNKIIFLLSREVLKCRQRQNGGKAMEGTKNKSKQREFMSCQFRAIIFEH